MRDVTGRNRRLRAAPDRVRPRQAIRLARAAAGAFALHGQRQRFLGASMTLSFLLGGGRQRHGATLTLWRVWPRWSTPLVLAASCMMMLTLLRSGLPLTVLVVGQGAVLVASIAALLRAVAGWTGLPSGSVMIADVANAGDSPGAGRELLAAVCAEADQRNWTLALAVRRDRSKVVALYVGLMFVPLADRGTRVIMVRPAQH